MNIPLTCLGSLCGLVFIPVIGRSWIDSRKKSKYKKIGEQARQRYPNSLTGSWGPLVIDRSEHINKINAETVLPKTHPLQGQIKSSKPKSKQKIQSNELPKWFIGTWGINEPSPAEQKIIDELNKYNVFWKREVSFEGLLSASRGNCRFDFYLPNYNTIIEYHGKLWHNTPDRVFNDNLKVAFCDKYNINLVVYTSKHYYNLETCIANLMNRLNILSKH